MLFGVSRRWDQGVSVQETTNGKQGDGSIFRDMLAMVKANITGTTIELRHTCIASARKLLTIASGETIVAGMEGV